MTEPDGSKNDEGKEFHRALRKESRDLARDLAEAGFWLLGAFIGASIFTAVIHWLGLTADDVSRGSWRRVTAYALLVFGTITGGRAGIIYHQRRSGVPLRPQILRAAWQGLAIAVAFAVLQLFLRRSC